ncbi:MAG: glycoside hydrolase family 43 protein [Lachnospiraceae bacterium]|jgi:beta-xylosidase|nr:glycoside hydrolase family 43 protein [Lachnospiraceae bacterium]
MAKQKEPLVTHIYTADPSAHVFNGKIYVYPSHDLEHDGEDNDDGDEYQMEDYHILSMDNVDAPCVDNGEALNMRDVPWVSKQMWAPDCAFKNGKYYLYFPARDKDLRFHIGVAVSDSPVGPFKPEDDYIKGSFSIDPAVLVDDDGSAYIYFGGLWGGQLEKWQTGEFVENPAPIPADAKALGPQVAKLTDDMLQFADGPEEITILDENGEPIKAGDEDRRYFEGPWMHKYNGKYYLSYSTGTTHYLVYAIGDSPKGPFTYQGRILEPVIGWTTHHSIVEYEGKWYLFYHDSSLSGGVNHRRCVKFRELKYDENGKIIPMKPYDED